MNEEELLASAQKKIDKFVSWLEWPQKGKFEVYRTRDGVCLLNRKTGKYTLKSAIHDRGSPLSLQGVVGGKYSMSAIDACYCLSALEVLTTDEEKVFRKWYWRDSQAKDREHELNKLKKLAQDLGAKLLWPEK